MDGAARSDEPSAPDPTESLAELQAGLLDDATAAGLRRRLRDEPELAERYDALDRVRRDVAALGSDPESAGPVPPHVTARVTAALGDARHAARHPMLRPRTIVALVGGAAALIGVGVGAVTLLRPADPLRDALGPTAALITREAATFPFTDEQLRQMLDTPADFGPLADPRRRAACLSALGYPGTVDVLGAAPFTNGVVMLLPANDPATFDAVAVGPSCSAVDTAVLARRTVLIAPAASSR